MTNAHQGYGFVEFRAEEDADYAVKILNMVKLYGGCCSRHLFPPLII